MKTNTVEQSGLTMDEITDEVARIYQIPSEILRFKTNEEMTDQEIEDINKANSKMMKFLHSMSTGEDLADLKKLLEEK